MEKVTRPEKVVTDELVLKRLAEQGIDEDYVEFFQDYATRRIAGGRSPYTKTYRDLKSGMRILVSQGLPMVDAYGFKHELRWRERNGVIENGNNLFHSIISNGTIRIIVLSDQPNGVKKDTELSYHAQLLINGSEILPTSVVPLILATDPINPNYHDNVILWQYDTICRRRVRIIEGRYRERWLIDRHPNGRVEIRHNKTGALKLKLGTARDAAGEILKVRVVGDSEIVEASEFDGKTFPVEIGASPETFYPDAHIETSSVDGRVQTTGRTATWAGIRTAAGTRGEDDETAEWASIYQAHATTGRWQTLGRAIFLFDVSGLPDVNTITVAVFSVYGESKANNIGTSPDINVYESTPASNTALENSDFADVLSDPYCDTPITYAGYTVGGYNDFALNANPGIVAAQAASDGNTVLKLGTRNANYDVSGTPPTWQSGTVYDGLRVYFADYGSNKPKLVVTYTVPSPGWAGGDVLGVAIGTVAEINGKPLSAIAEFNGKA